MLRKRDDVDDFLDALGNPSPWSSYTGANTVKRSYSDSVPEQPTLVMSGKRPKENDTQSHGGSSPPL